MSFVGVIETFGQDIVKGWASYVFDGKYKHVDVVLRFRSGLVISPNEYVDRGRSRGFIFRLPEELQRIKWSELIEDFDCIAAICPEHPEAGEWQVPFYKSVLLSRNVENRTALLAKQLKEYSVKPKSNGRIACFTIAFNEHLVLPIWARYYASHFGPENLFVIDQGSERPYDDLLPKGVNIIRLPREKFDNWLLVRLVEFLQRFLLESYDSVLYTDSDEMVCCDPKILSGLSLSEFLLALPSPVGITTGYDLFHAITLERPYDPARPVLSQRRFIKRQPYMDKPLIVRIPMNWVPGFHSAAEGGQQVSGLYLLHFRWFDLDHALAKGGFYRNSEWSAFDVENQIASYQRQGEDEILRLFRSYDNVAAGIKHAEYDPSEQYTVVPDWMRNAVFV